MSQNRDQPVNRLADFRIGNVTGSIDDDSRVGRKQAVGTNPAALIETAGNKIATFELNRVLICSRLAGDLAENQVVSLQGSNHQGRTAFGLTEVGERKIEDYDISSYKLAQAASSSSVSQSLASEDSAASVGTAFSACDSLSDRMNSSNLSRSGSGRC